MKDVYEIRCDVNSVALSNFILQAVYDKLDLTGRIVIDIGAAIGDSAVLLLLLPNLLLITASLALALIFVFIICFATVISDTTGLSLYHLLQT